MVMQSTGDIVQYLSMGICLHLQRYNFWEVCVVMMKLMHDITSNIMFIETIFEHYKCDIVCCFMSHMFLSVQHIQK